MSKPVKELILADYKKRFESVEGALLIDVRGVDANENNAIRLDLAKKDIHFTVLKNTLARKALEGTRLEPLTAALDGPSALAFGAESVVEVARELVAWARKIDELDLKGAILEGLYFEGKEGVDRLSLYPTRPEAQARAVLLILSPAANLSRAVLSPGARILGIVDQIENRLEQGETIQKVG